MGSKTVGTRRRTVRALAADAVERFRRPGQARRQVVALTIGVVGLAAALVIALYSR